MQNVQNLNKNSSKRSEDRVFDNSLISTFLQCPRLAYYTNILRIRPKVEPVYLKFGSAIHEALAVGYAHGFHEKEMNEAFLDTLPEAQRDEKVYGIMNGLSLLKWIRTQPMPFAEVLEVEIGFVIDIGNPSDLRKVGETGEMLYGGMIDLLVRHPQYNSVVVVDHKTTARLSQPFLDIMTLARQFTGYILAANMNYESNDLWPSSTKTDTNCKTAIIQVFTVKPTKTCGFTVTSLPTTRTESELNSFLVETREFIRQFQKCESEGFWPRSGQCGGYGKSCPYLYLCVQFHETPPRIDEIDSGYIVSEPWAPWSNCKTQWNSLNP